MWMAELAERSGVRVPTIKFYLREGLVPRGEERGATRAAYGEEQVGAQGLEADVGAHGGHDPLLGAGGAGAGAGADSGAGPGPDAPEDPEGPGDPEDPEDPDPPLVSTPPGPGVGDVAAAAVT